MKSLLALTIVIMVLLEGSEDGLGQGSKIY